VYDTETDEVRLTDNGAWVRLDDEVLDGLVRSLARAKNDHVGEVDADGYLEVDGCRDLDVGLVLDREVVDGSTRHQHVDDMADMAGIDPSRSWGFNAGPPPEVEVVARRLREVGLDPSDRLFRLRFGRKDPYDGVDKSLDPPRRGRDPEDLVGNYGVDVLSRDRGLVVVDVDHPDMVDDEDLRPTWSVSSPHGSDDRRHLVYWCDNKRRIARSLGSDERPVWSVQGLPFGDLWCGANRYIVGVGSQLGAAGCDKDEHETGGPTGCDVCTDPDRGYYREVDDVGVSYISADEVLDLVPDDMVDDDGVDEAAAAGNDVARTVDDDDLEDDVARCSSCGTVRPVEALKETAVGDSVIRVCDEDRTGGCN